jgi:hypothetical protein
MEGGGRGATGGRFGADLWSYLWAGTEASEARLVGDLWRISSAAAMKLQLATWRDGMICGHGQRLPWRWTAERRAGGAEMAAREPARRRAGSDLPWNTRTFLGWRFSFHDSGRERRAGGEEALAAKWSTICGSGGG